MEKTEKFTLTVGVYAPQLQGFYYGEFIGQIHQLCMVKSYRFSLLNTDGFGEYQSLLGVEHLDIAIILRNAVHPNLILKMQELGIAVVSVSFDYFPLDVPVVTCDNEFGLELAFNHLLKKGHRKLAYIGDISQYDLRKRYEAFCDQHEINGIPLDESQVFIVDNSLFSGGYHSANEYIRRDCDATGVICGAGLTAIGFSQKLNKIDEQLHNGIDIVSFDAISLFPILAKNICIVDQNSYLLAYRAIEMAERLRDGGFVDRHEFIQPKIVDPTSDDYNSDNTFLATSAELSELHNPNYMKSVVSNFFEWPREIARSRFDDIMILAPLFPRHIHEVIFSRFITNKSNEKVLKVIKHINLEKVSYVEKSEDLIWTLSDYPKEFGSFRPERYTSVIHVPIQLRKKIWGVLSFFGENMLGVEPSSLSAACGFAQLVVDFWKLELFSKIKSQDSSVQKKVPDSDEDGAGKIQWDVAQSSALWDVEALEMLGYTSELEKHIYKTMELGDRVHSDQESLLREMLDQASADELFVRVQLRCKNKAYEYFYIGCYKDESSGNLMLSIQRSHENE